MKKNKTKKIKNKKTPKKQKKVRKQNFIVLGDLIRSSNKVFIEARSLFPCQQQNWWNGWEIYNVIEIKNNDMLQLFLGERR